MTDKPNEPRAADNSQWQYDVLNKLIFASLNEQRRTRRWNIFFKALLMAYLFVLLLLMLLPPIGQDGERFSISKHTALIEVKGIIAPETKASADHIVGALRSAFKDKNTAGVILRINSPGGSPVQSGYIYDEIKRLRDKHKEIKVYAVIADVGASGAYYIAAAADEIYADKASVVGSIGVVMNGFGFVETLKKLGIERRLYTAGDHKGFLDPFSPQRKEETAHITHTLANIHEQFTTAVKQGRGERLQNNPKIFSGLIWSGEESLKLGLIDGLGNSSYVARELIKAERIVDFTPQEGLLDRLTDRLGTSLANTLAEKLGVNSQMPLQ